jgi:hypothetical protein
MRSLPSKLSTSSLLRLGSWLLGVPLAGCGDSGGDAASPVITDGPLYAINTRVYGIDFGTPSSYISLVADLEGGDMTLDAALEVPGAGSLWGVPGSGELYFVSAENLTVTRYRLAASGSLEQTGRLGLTGVGVSGLVTEAITFHGPGRGFLFDLGSALAVELDLVAMEITTTHDLAEMLIDSSELTFLAQDGFHRRGGELVGAVYGSTALFDTVADVSKVGFFDPTTGALEVIEAPCGGLNYSFEAENGDFYFSTDPWVAAIHALDAARAPAPCMARLPAGSRVFDPTVTALNEVTGGIAGGIIPSSDGSAYVRVLDEAVFPLSAETDFLAPFSVPAWTTWRIELPHPVSASRVDRPHIAGGIKFARIGGQVYQNESSGDFASTLLIRTTGDDAPAAGLRVPGVPWNLVQVR